MTQRPPPTHKQLPVGLVRRLGQGRSGLPLRRIGRSRRHDASSPPFSFSRRSSTPRRVRVRVCQHATSYWNAAGTLFVPPLGRVPRREPGTLRCDCVRRVTHVTHSSVIGRRVSNTPPLSVLCLHCSLAPLAPRLAMRRTGRRSRRSGYDNVTPVPMDAR